MSGILGVCTHDGAPVSGETLDHMMHWMAHRGPDGQQCWREGTVGVGHALFSTTPEAAYERQPLQSRDRALVLVADARIDNRTALIRDLRLQGRPPATIADSELILAGYECWGVDVLDHLVGDYAFALWDGRERRFFCARDPIGIRPFYYHASPQAFVFASAISAVLAHPGVRDAHDEEHIHAFLADRTDDGTRTFYADVRRLPAAHALWVEADGTMRQWRYWKPEDRLSELRFSDDAAYEEGFRSVFQTATRSCLRASDPVGIQLSGGMDSSAVAAVSRDVVRTEGQVEALHTFTGVFPSVQGSQKAAIDEWGYAQDVLAQGGFQSHVLAVDEVSPLYGMESMIAAYGQPFRPRSHYVMQQVAEAAREAGVRVMLDGSEGDLVIGYGYDYFQQLAQQGEWGRFAEVAHQYAQNCAAGGRHYPPDRAFWAHGVDSLLATLFGGHVGTFLRGSHTLTRELDVSFVRVLVQAAREAFGPGRRGVERMLPNGEGIDSENGMSILETRARRLWANPMLADTLEGVDALMAGWGLEARHPFFDRRVVEYCLALPPEQRLKGGWTRSIVRRALGDLLPASVRTRVGKADLGVQLPQRLMQRETDRLEGLHNVEALHRYVSPEQIQRLYGAFRGEKSIRRVTPLLRLMVLARWLGQGGGVPGDEQEETPEWRGGSSKSDSGMGRS